MRDSVLKQRSDCNRKFHKKSDYPEEFENIWGTRKVSDYPSRKHAGFAVFLIMNKEIKTIKEQLADEIKQREKAEKILLRLSKSGDGSHKDKHASFYDCLTTLQIEFDERKNLAMHYFAEKEKQDKENKE